MSSSLVDRVRDFRNSGATSDERLNALVLRGRFADAEVQAAWIKLSTDPPANFEIQVHDPQITGDVGPADAFEADRVVIVTITKPAVTRIGFFFFGVSLEKYLRDEVGVVALRVADLTAQEAFSARGLDVAPWMPGQALPPPPPLPTAINPRNLVADHAPEREVPRDLSPWLLLTRPAVPGVAFEAWCAIAARRLLSGLVSSASREDGVVYLRVSGPPPYRIRADDPEIAGAWKGLTDVAEWVFLSVSDVEARHRLFGGELARASRPGQDFPTTLERAFEAAKIAYDAHIQSASRETLKALADLRKTVVEESQKVTQRTQDMTAALGRDLAVSAAPFVIKILADAGKVTTPAIAAAFYFVAAVFLMISFALQWRINESFLRGQQLSRQRWMQTLSAYISTKEREEISDGPIDMAIRSYRSTRTFLLFIYIVLVIALTGAGVYTLRNSALPLPTGGEIQSDSSAVGASDDEAEKSTVGETTPAVPATTAPP